MSFSFGFGSDDEAGGPAAGGGRKTRPAAALAAAPPAAREAGAVRRVALPSPAKLAATLAGAKWETVSAAASLPLRKRTLQSKQVEAPYASALQESDLLPGVYEGGFKLWECAVDLAVYLAELPEEQAAAAGGAGTRVLELGCGHGLPGLVSLCRGAHVDFLDYNAEVVQQLTIPNVAAAAADHCGAGNAAVAEEMMSRAQFFSGDWCGLLSGDSPAHAKYDLILTSDTLYNEACVRDLAALIPELLTESGVAYVASKRHYFGVGGGTDDFRRQSAAVESQTDALRVAEAADAAGAGIDSSSSSSNAGTGSAAAFDGPLQKRPRRQERKRRIEIAAVAEFEDGKSNVRDLVTMRFASVT